MISTIPTSSEVSGRSARKVSVLEYTPTRSALVQAHIARLTLQNSVDEITKSLPSSSIPKGYDILAFYKPGYIYQPSIPRSKTIKLEEVPPNLRREVVKNAVYQRHQILTLSSNIKLIGLLSGQLLPIIEESKYQIVRSLFVYNRMENPLKQYKEENASYIKIEKGKTASILEAKISGKDLPIQGFKDLNEWLEGLSARPKLVEA